MLAFKYKVTCPRWALPAEEVPIHVQFDKSVTPLLQSVNVTLHESLEFRDFINLTDYERNGRALTIKSIGKSTLSDYDFLGFAVATVSPFGDLKRMVPVKIKFNYRDGTSEKHIEHARIFRPLLELDASPDRVVITDENEGRLELPIAMKSSGFGQIKVTAVCTIGGRVVSHTPSLPNETVREIVKNGAPTTCKNAGTGVSADPDCVDRAVSRIVSLLRGRGELAPVHGGLRSGACAGILGGLSRGSKEKFMDTSYDTDETYVGPAIAEVLDRNVGENITMEPARILAQIAPPVAKATVRLLYRDLAGNEYDPVEKQVEIVDKRKDRVGLGVEIVIRVRSVDERLAYRRVRTMEIDADE